jgi:hypothetical protein
MAALRKAARLWAPRERLTRQRSSRQCVSRIQCSRFSTPQWPRHRASSLAASARWGERLVMGVLHLAGLLTAPLRGALKLEDLS